MSMPCQMDAKQSLGENKQHAYFAIKYDLIPLGKVSQGEAHETHLSLCTLYNQQHLLYTHSENHWKRHSHLKRDQC